VSTWQAQAREYLIGEDPRLVLSDAETACGAIAGKVARIVFVRLMGGPIESPNAWIDDIAAGCRAFLAAYEAHRKEGE